MKYKVSVLIAVLAIAALWRLRSSHNEMGEATFSTYSSRSAAGPGQPAPPVREPAQNETPATTAAVPPAHGPGSGAQSRAEAIAGFEKKRTSDQPLPDPKDAFKGLRLGKPLPVNGSSFQVLGARAIPRGSYAASMGPILFEQGGFAVVAAQGENLRDLLIGEQDRPVLVNASNGRPAIVTGTLSVKFKDMQAASRVAAKENLQVIAVDDSIQTIYFRPPAGYLLLAGQQRLQHEPDIERVEIELYQSRKEAK